jgi:carbamoyltransferase
VYIIGISFGYHDSSVALIKDGVTIFATSEERFSRKKHDNAFPNDALNYLMKKFDLTSDIIEKVVYYENPYKKMGRLLNTSIQDNNYNFFEQAFKGWVTNNKLDPLKLIQEYFDFDDRSKITFVDHHHSHVGSAYFCSTMKDCAVLTIDGVGEYETITISHGKDNKIEKVFSQELPHSLGLVYSAFTYFLGFEVNEGEYKVMGMASFGEPIYKEKIEELVKFDEDKGICIDTDYFEFTTPKESHLNSKFYEKFAEQRDPNEPFFLTENEAPTGIDNELIEPLSKKNRYFANLAASLQAVTEDMIECLIKKALKMTNTNSLCFSGGVALNATANGEIKKRLDLDSFFIQPAAGDGGSAIGSALYYYYHICEYSRVIKPFSPFLGYKNSEDDIKKAIDGYLVKHYTRYDDEDAFIDKVSDLLNNNNVLGWVYNEAEMGPRALGHRSIIANPAGPEIKRIVNEKIKFREPFRPFAPSCLKDEAKNWFEVLDPIDENSPENYMISIVNVIENQREKVPAIVHVDNSARVQLVSEDNYLYHKLISRFFQKSGIPMLLNTSFNLKGEPVVNRAIDAMKTFEVSNMDALAIYPYIIYKKGDL